jgi:hypothetical protein
MRLVLPTLWSPSKTILVRFGGADEKSADTGVVEVSIGWLYRSDPGVRENVGY